MINGETILIAVVALPGFSFALLGLVWLFGFTPPERWVNRFTSLIFSVSTLLLVPLAAALAETENGRLVASPGNLFALGHYSFPMTLLADRTSFPMLALTVILTGLVGGFSFRYLHRERGFFRFFLLLHLFAFGSMLIYAAASFDLLIAGWELVGITSVLLIAFFQERPEPVASALTTFTMYRAADIGLLMGVFMLHHYMGTASFLELADLSFSSGLATLAGLLLLVGACGKSAQIPFSGWLPRAMEGPTPSSAIFYGAISVHAGAYLLLRAEPLLEASVALRAAVIAVGLSTAILGVMAGRASAEAKTALAYGALSQVGLIFAEIGFGWTTLALIHIVGHATVRTLDFLRTPSMMHEFHHMHAASGGQLDRPGIHYKAFLPKSVRLRLYRFALMRGFLDEILERFIANPLLRLGGWLLWWDRAILDDGAPAQKNVRASGHVLTAEESIRRVDG